MLNQRSDKQELLRIAEAVAVEKSIDKELVLTSMESAIQKAARTRFGSDNDIRAKIDRESGDITLHKVLKIPISAESHSDANCLDAAQFGSGNQLSSEHWQKVPNHISKRHCNPLDAQNFCSETRFLPEEIKPEARPVKIPVTSLAL